MFNQNLISFALQRDASKLEGIPDAKSCVKYLMSFSLYYTQNHLCGAIYGSQTENLVLRAL